MRKRFLALFLVLFVTVGCGPEKDDYVSNEVYNDHENDDTFDFSGGSYSESISERTEFIETLLSGSNGGLNIKLPGYSYFQGVIQTGNHLVVAGQVRVVGGVLGVTETDATANLYSGAMITANAQAFVGDGDSFDGLPGLPTRIKKIEEVPNP